MACVPEIAAQLALIAAPPLPYSSRR